MTSLPTLTKAGGRLVRVRKEPTVLIKGNSSPQQKQPVTSPPVLPMPHFKMRSSYTILVQAAVSSLPPL